jgi:hypothetical protein
MHDMRPCYGVDAHANVMDPSNKSRCMGGEGMPRGALVRQAWREIARH